MSIPFTINTGGIINVPQPQHYAKGQKIKCNAVKPNKTF